MGGACYIAYLLILSYKYNEIISGLFCVTVFNTQLKLSTLRNIGLNFSTLIKLKLNTNKILNTYKLKQSTLIIKIVNTYN